MAADGKLDRPAVLRPVEGSIDVACRQADRDQQPNDDPEQRGRLAGLATCQRHHQRAGEADDDAGHTQEVRTADTEQDRQHQRDDGRQREHDAGVAGAEMRDGRKHQQVGDGIGNRRRDHEIAQLAAGEQETMLAQQKHDQENPASPERNDECPQDRRHAGAGGDLAERQRQAEQTRRSPAAGRTPGPTEISSAAGCCVRSLRVRGKIWGLAAQLRSSGNTGIGMNSTPSSARPRASSGVASP